MGSFLALVVFLSVKRSTSMVDMAILLLGSMRSSEGSRESRFLVFSKISCLVVLVASELTGNLWVMTTISWGINLVLSGLITFPLMVFNRYGELVTS